MNVKRIVVGEIVGNCFECDFCVLLGGNYICDIKHAVLFHDLKTGKPSWCPLEVENECVWGTHTFDELADGDWKYCPSCGKRIRYEEE